MKDSDPTKFLIRVVYTVRGEMRENSKLLKNMKEIMNENQDVHQLNIQKKDSYDQLKQDENQKGL